MDAIRTPFKALYRMYRDDGDDLVELTWFFAAPGAQRFTGATPFHAAGNYEQYNSLGPTDCGEVHPARRRYGHFERPPGLDGSGDYDGTLDDFRGLSLRGAGPLDVPTCLAPPAFDLDADDGAIGEGDMELDSPDMEVVDGGMVQLECTDTIGFVVPDLGEITYSPLWIERGPYFVPGLALALRIVGPVTRRRTATGPLRLALRCRAATSFAAAAFPSLPLALRVTALVLRGPYVLPSSPLALRVTALALHGPYASGGLRPALRVTDAVVRNRAVPSPVRPALRMNGATTRKRTAAQGMPLALRINGTALVGPYCDGPARLALRLPSSYTFARTAPAAVRNALRVAPDVSRTRTAASDVRLSLHFSGVPSIFRPVGSRLQLCLRITADVATIPGGPSPGADCDSAGGFGS